MTGQGEAREQIARALADAGFTRLGPVARAMADAVLACPAIAAAFAAVDGQCGPLVRALDQAIAQRDELRATVERVRALADDLARSRGGWDGEVADLIRRALDGEP